MSVGRAWCWRAVASASGIRWPWAGWGASAQVVGRAWCWPEVNAYEQQPLAVAGSGASAQAHVSVAPGRVPAVAAYRSESALTT